MKRRSSLVRELIELVILALLIFFAVRLVVQVYHVEGVSMQPGLQNDEYVLVYKMAYIFSASPQRGDVVVFHYPLDTSQDFIKRVIGLPGDTIRTDNTHIWVNGTELNEPYITGPTNPLAKIWKVPPGSYFVLGDNRLQSDDSRYWGFVPKDYIVGKAVAIYWPVSAWELINTYQSVYAQIKK
ncbi:signal peptidase I [Ktedonosporobacter rubrisoli]|uniref:Signal peptidase I n=1 Tax=Ktedonosporobacter rubrisoli TaxID=2509675 RepID=A0A4P6K5G9_KTERU|nr:signal peptidase I [Ktedonosporobacter rubrisoli]